MKIQALAVIAVMVLLPILIVLNAYIDTQAKTLSYQVEYDNKLQNSTYDALKAFQLNTANSDTSDIANSKIRDVKAGANTFLNSLANNFSMDGYNKETLSNFVPAVVFTMYDGYYIYSPYTNKLDNTNDIYDDTTKTFTGKSDTDILGDRSPNSYDIPDPVDPGSDPLHPKTITYESPFYNGKKLTGLKPYVYYSCRYKKGTDIDVVITYSLDSYITVQGKARDNDLGSPTLGQIVPIDISGYLLSNVTYIDSADPASISATYRGVTINNEIGYQENVYNGTGIQPCPCRIINGIRYYDIDGGNTVASLLNGKWQQANIAHSQRIGTLTSNSIDSTFSVSVQDVKNNTNAVEYYRDAVKLKNELKKYGLEKLTVGDAYTSDGTEKLVDIRDSNGNLVYDYLGEASTEIFKQIDDNDNCIEEPESNFNEHRLDIIKYSIESNLSAAINNFNIYSTSDIKFQMPKLQETEWELIYNNICILSFMQGLHIGGKIYSGHSVVPNTDNKEYISEDSIEFVGNDNQIYKATYKDLISKIDGDTSKARTKMSLIRASTEDVSTHEERFFYRYPMSEGPWLAYKSIVTEQDNNINLNGCSNMYDYIDSLGNNSISKMYYTALGREREGMYRVQNEAFGSPYFPTSK